MKILFAVVILSTFVDTNFSLRCYNCVHSSNPVDHAEGIENDPSCKNANPKHIIEYTDAQSCDWKSVQQKYEMLRRNHPRLKINYTVPINGKQANQVSCFDEVFTDGRYDYTMRGCTFYEVSYCETYSNTDGENAKYCACNTDACNKNTSSLASSISILSFDCMIALVIAIFVSCQKH